MICLFTSALQRGQLRWLVVGLLWVSAGLSAFDAAAAVDFPGPPPGRATASASSVQCHLENAVVGMSWQISSGKLRPGEIVDRLTGKTIPAGTEVFSIVSGDGRVLRASDLKLLKTPHAEDISARSGALWIADRSAGKRIVATLADNDGSFQVEWQAVLRDGDNYVRQELVLRALKKDMPLTEVVLIELPVEKSPAVGTVLGSPVVAGNLLFACESPLADNRGQPGRVRCAFPWKTVLKAGDSLRSASVVGVAPADQMRRAFLYYVERSTPGPINRSCTTTPGTTSPGRTGSLTRRRRWQSSSSSAGSWSKNAASRSIPFFSTTAGTITGRCGAFMPVFHAGSRH